MSKKKIELESPLIDFFNIAERHEINITDLHALVMIEKAKKESGSHFYILFSYRELEKNGWLDSGLRYTEKAKVLLNDLLWLFKPPVKKVVNPLTLEQMTQFNELFPSHVLPTGKRGRCNMKEVESAFVWFFKNYDYDWTTILNATLDYLREKEQDNWNFCRRSKYYVRKMMQDKSFESDLAEYCERSKNGTWEDGTLPRFHEKVL